MSRTLPDTRQDTPPEVDADDLQDGDRVVIQATRFGGGRQIRIVGTARPDHERPEFVVEETDPDWTWLLDESGKLYVHEGGPWRRPVADDWSLHRVPATDGGEPASGIMKFVEPTGWRFYRYGRDEGGNPMFSFWMDVDRDTGICLYERGGKQGRWLDTHHSSDDYAPIRPSDDLRKVLRQLLVSEEGVEAERVESLADHESYFARIIVGTLEDGKDLPDGVWAFLEDVAGTSLVVTDAE